MFSSAWNQFYKFTNLMLMLMLIQCHKIWILKPQYHWTQSSDLTSQGEFKNQQDKGYHSRAIGFNKCPNPEQFYNLRSYFVYESTMFLALRIPGWPKTAWHLFDIYSSCVFDGVRVAKSHRYGRYICVTTTVAFFFKTAFKIQFLVFLP